MNAKNAPPSAAAATLASHRRSTKYMAAAEPAKPTVVSRVRLAIGPAISVTGVSTTAGPSSEVFHIALMPCGALTAVVTRAGRWPCASAVATYRMNQVAR